MPNSFRAPARHGEILLLPHGSLLDVVRSNEAALSENATLASMRAETREEVLALANRWTSELIGPVACPGDSKHWVIGGHQPELFHPGVWVKNSMMNALASELGGISLNLVVDNDICSGASISVPQSPERQSMTTLEWDHPQPQSPWEERTAPDQSIFGSFGERCRDRLRLWGIEPLAATQDWRAFSERTIVDRLVRLRATFERACGVENLELKVSDLADTRSFRRFLIQAISQAATLRQTYNAALSDYRAMHHIRSRSHPVPALDATDFGIEVPFWVWRAGETRRHRLFVRQIGKGQVCLHDGQQEIGRVPIESESRGLAALADFRKQGWKIRPRALSLTLFCRVFLGSVFVHGIGGAKYDEMTDVLIERWIGQKPPALIVATSTMRLFERFAAGPAERLIAQDLLELRRIRWNPESISVAKHRGLDTEPLISEKQQLLAAPIAPAARHARIQAINTALHSGLVDYEQRLRSQLQGRLAALPYQNSLRSREYSASLFPATELNSLFLRARQQVIKQK